MSSCLDVCVDEVRKWRVIANGYRFLFLFLFLFWMMKLLSDYDEDCTIL